MASEEERKSSADAGLNECCSGRIKKLSPVKKALDYNKWYIKPKLRCKPKPSNLKENYRAY